MIVQLTGTIVELFPTHAVIDCMGVGYELGISSITASQLPAVGTSGVTVLTRLIVREDAQELYGFATREERALFDQLRAISGVGPKLALAVLSTFTPAQLATVVTTQDAARMALVPGVGRKKATRLLVELSDVFQKNAELKMLVGLTDAPGTPSSAPSNAPASEAADALLSMGFTSAEVELALDGAAEAGVSSTKDLLSYALKRLGGGR